MSNHKIKKNNCQYTISDSQNNFNLSLDLQLFLLEHYPNQLAWYLVCQESFAVFKNFVYKIALYKLKDKDLADEVLQTICEKIWEKRDLPKSIDNPKAYVRTMVYNQCNKVWEKREKPYHPSNYEDLSAISDQASEDQADQPDCRREVCQVIDQANPGERNEMRRLILKISSEGFKPREIPAVVLERTGKVVTVKYVTDTIYHGRKKLEKYLSKTGYIRRLGKKSK